PGARIQRVGGQGPAPSKPLAARRRAGGVAWWPHATESQHRKCAERPPAPGYRTDVALPTRIRIISCPPGEAPLSVRLAWVGLELPLDPRRAGRQLAMISGVLSSPRAWSHQIVALVTRPHRVPTRHPLHPPD